MARYRYQALDKDGQGHDGEVDATSVQQAIIILEARGWTVQSISSQEEPSDPFAGPTGRVDDTVSSTSAINTAYGQTVMREQLLRLQQHASDVAPALRAYAAEQPWPRSRRHLLTVARRIEEGDLAQMAMSFQSLPSLWIPLMASLKSNSDPAQALSEFVIASQQEDELHRQWRAILAYPVVLASIVTGTFLLLCYLVVPLFRDIYTEFDLDLPAITELLIQIYDLTIGSQVWVLAAVVVFVTMLLLTANRFAPPAALAAVRSRLPIPFGKFTSVSRLASFLAGLLEAGLPTGDALRVAGSAVGRRKLDRAVWDLAHRLEAGEPSHGHSAPPLTAAIVHVVTSDWPLPSRVRMLREISRCHAQKAADRLAWTGGIVEPVFILAVGLFVGGVVIALTLPLVKLIEGLT